MDPLERAKANLKSQRGEIEKKRTRALRGHDMATDRGEKRRLLAVVWEYDQHLEVIDYVLNILQNVKEE